MSKMRLLLILIGGLALMACRAAVETHPAVIRSEPPRLVLNPDDALLIQSLPGGPAAIFDRQNGEYLWHLPAGRWSANGNTFIAAVPQANSTQLRHYLPHQAQPTAVYDVDGAAEIAAVSANGRWVVFHTTPSLLSTLKQEVETTFQVLDLKRSTFSEVITLEGDFAVEGIDNVGRSVYLIEHLPEQGDGNHYRVRVFDAQHYMLDLTPIRDKRFLDEIMAGYAWGTATDPQGRWLTTLYVNSLNDTAFIHALSLGDRWALCLALPSKAPNHELLKYYGLALTPIGDTVFAVNPLLGILVEINLQDTSLQKNLAFAAVKKAPQTNLSPEALLNTAVTADGQTLYFAFERQLWRYDRQAGFISGPFTAAEPIVDLALGAGENELLLAFDNYTLQPTAVTKAFPTITAQK